jgi:hypothetical protein
MVRTWTVEGSEDAIKQLAKLFGKARIQEKDGTKEILEYQWWNGPNSYIRIIDKEEGESYFTKAATE